MSTLPSWCPCYPESLLLGFDSMPEIMKFRLERQFRLWIVNLYMTEGWEVSYVPDSRMAPPGFPDLTLGKRGQVFFSELKMPGNHLSDKQVVWKNIIESAGMEYHLWYPKDIEEIKQRCLAIEPDDSRFTEE